MEQFVTGYGLPGAVILALVGVLLWIVRKLFNGDIVTRREADALKDQNAILQDANDRLISAVQDLTVTAHTGPIALRSIAQTAEKKAGDET